MDRSRLGTSPTQVKIKEKEVAKYSDVDSPSSSLNPITTHPTHNIGRLPSPDHTNENNIGPSPSTEHANEQNIWDNFQASRRTNHSRHHTSALKVHRAPKSEDSVNRRTNTSSSHKLTPREAREQQTSSLASALPTSDSCWSLVSYQDHREQQIDSVIRTQEARFQAAKLGRARLGTSRVQVTIEEPPQQPPPLLPPPSRQPPPLLPPSSRQPPPLLPPSATKIAPAPGAAAAPTPLSRRDSRKAVTAAKEFPRTEESEKAGCEPAKGSSLGRKIKNSPLGGKNPYKAEKERQEQATGGPLTQLPRPDMVLVHPGMEPISVHFSQSAALASTARSSKPQRQYKPPPVISQTHASYSSPDVYSSQPSHLARGSPTSLTLSSPPPPPPPPMRHAPPSNPPLPKDMICSAWAMSPSAKPATGQPPVPHQYAATSQPRASGQDPAPTPRPAAKVNHAHLNDAWNDSIGQLSSRRAQQGGYHMDLTNSRPVEHSSQIQVTYQSAKQSKLQQHATDTPPSHELAYHCHNAKLPLISENTRLSELKEDYRDPGSEGSEIIRHKINYLRFELGYRGLHQARSDGNCFYQSFAFAYLEQMLFSDDRAIAVINALEHLEMAQKLVELVMPGNVISSQMHLFVQDLIRGMELQNIAHKMLVQTFQDQRDSDNIVAYMRLLALAYVRFTPEIHDSVFRPDDSSVVISQTDFCSEYVERLGQDADHIQISALSRTLNVPIRIYRLDEKIDGIALHKGDIPAHCTRFIPTGPPVITDPVSLLFRPGRYDILERVGPPV